jgi:hypothetical protein
MDRQIIQKFRVLRPIVVPATLICVLLLGAVLGVSAEDTYWEGGISISPYGMLPKSGRYAASNAFAQDTKVRVHNAETGKSVEVRVVERLDDPHLFMLVSPEAGEALGIREDEVVRGTVTPAPERDDLIRERLGGETAYSADPDRNPSAEVDESGAVDDAEGLAAVEEYLDEKGGAEDKVLAPETAKGPSEPAPASTPAPAPEAVIAQEAEEIPQAESMPHMAGTIIAAPEELPEPDVQEGEEREEIVIAPKEGPIEELPEGPLGYEVQALFAQERDTTYTPLLPVPPEEAASEKRIGPSPSLAYIDGSGVGKGDFAAAEPRLPEAERTVPGLADTGPDDRELEIAALHEPKPVKEAEKAAEAPPAEQPVEESPEVAVEEEDTQEEAPIPEGAEIVLEPAEERPPEGGPDKEAPPVKTTKPVTYDEALVQRVNYTGKLSADSYYLQLAAYQEIETAKNLASKLLPRYPVTIYTKEGETFPFKVMVGPLNEDESGVLLYSFTAGGYRDAFLRRGSK